MNEAYKGVKLNDRYIYRKKESKDWILQNDLYFNLNTSNEEMSENEINLIQQVDEAKLTPDKHIETSLILNFPINICFF